MIKKSCSKLGTEELIFNLVNGVYIIPIANMILNGVVKAFPLLPGVTKRWLSPLIINHVGILFNK